MRCDGEPFTIFDLIPIVRQSLRLRRSYFSKREHLSRLKSRRLLGIYAIPRPPAARSAPVIDDPESPVLLVCQASEKVTNQTGCRKGQDPRPDYSFDYRPLHTAKTFYRADTHDRGGDHVSG